MTRVEFLKGLQNSLSDSLEKDIVAEKISFYINYINEEIAKGREEEDVVDELGDPRLIAKTIKTVSGVKGPIDLDHDNSEDSKSENRKSKTNYRRKETNDTYDSAFNGQSNNENTNGQRNPYEQFMSYNGARKTSVIGCAIAFIVIFIIISLIIRFFTNAFILLLGVGPVGVLLILLLLWFFFGRR